MTRKKVYSLLDDVQQFNSALLSVLQFKINECMLKSNINNIINYRTSMSNALKNLSDPFNNMKTEYLRLKVLSEIGVLIRPNEIVIANRLNDKLCNGVVLETKEVKITYKTSRHGARNCILVARCSASLISPGA